MSPQAPDHDPQQLSLRVSIEAVVTLDPERLDADPVWAMVSSRFDLLSGEGRRQALSLYLTRYLERETLLAANPATNGTAVPTAIAVEFP
jgi:hypothetical protein